MTNILSKINILSAPIHSGKTSALKSYTLKHQNCCGILCPDINGLRYIENIESGAILPFQKPINNSDDDILIGQYIFSNEGFKTARQVLLSIPIDTKKTIIIDEIGKLELQGGGLEPALSWLIDQIQSNQLNCILVVRDYLIDSVVNHYKINPFNLLTIDDF